MKTENEPLKWSINKAASEFGCARETVTRKLRERGTKPDPEGLYTTKQIHTALSGDLKAARTRSEEARAALLEKELAVKNGELISLAEVARMINETHGQVREFLNTWPAEAASRVNPSDPIHARNTLEEMLRDGLPKIRDLLPKPSPQQ